MAVLGGWGECVLSHWKVVHVYVYVFHHSSFIIHHFSFFISTPECRPCSRNMPAIGGTADLGQESESGESVGGERDDEDIALDFGEEHADTDALADRAGGGRDCPLRSFVVQSRYIGRVHHHRGDLPARLDDCSHVVEGEDDIGGGIDVGDVGGVGGVGLMADAEAPLAGEARGQARLDIARRVANEPGLREVEVVVGGGGEDHARGGLAPRVLAGELGDYSLGVKGAVVDGGEVDPSFGEEVTEAGVHGFDAGWGGSAARDDALIRDDDECVPGVGEACKAFGDAGKEAHEARVDEVAGPRGREGRWE